MRNLYTPATEEQLTQMSDEQLLSQYHLLTDVVTRTTGIPFERNPKSPREKLIELIEAGQRDYADEIVRDNLATSLENWGERNGMSDKPILFVEEACSGNCQCDQGGQR